jgi:SSS family solute:Na+ symporter
MIENRKGDRPHGLEVDKKMFRVNPGFAVGALIIAGLLVALYTVFW